MFNAKSILAFGLLLTSVLAAPLELETRAATTCGSKQYTSAQVSACVNAAADYVNNDSTAGGSTYPHVYNNREGFQLKGGKPYYEFPLKSGGAYSGGSPGADRCIINSSGSFAGAITHTGASGNNFVGCSGTR